MRPKKIPINNHSSAGISKFSSGYAIGAGTPISMIQRSQDTVFTFSLETELVKELGEIISFSVNNGFNISQELNEALAINDLINTTEEIRRGQYRNDL